MTTRVIKLTRGLTLGRIEKQGLIVTAILMSINALIGSRDLSLGAGLGGGLVLLNFLSIKLIVSALIGGGYSKGFSIFAILIKMAILIGVVVSLFMFVKLNIYGFLIGVVGVVIVIIGEGLRGDKDGAL
ncbi:MAG: ATP synthase subunit I [Ignavibacteriales bacterium]